MSVSHILVGDETFVYVCVLNFFPNPSLTCVIATSLLVATFQDDCIQARIAFAKRNTLSSLEANGPL